MIKTITTREAVSDCLIDIIDEKKPSHIVLGRCLKEHNDWTKQERAFVSRVCNGTVERLITLDYILGTLSKTKVARMKPVIRAVLRMSLYQLLFMGAIPESAICNEAVKIAKKRGFQGLSGFVNGVLRSAARKKEELLDFSEQKDMLERLSIEFSTPVWLIEQFIADYGEETAEGILKSQYESIPVTLRMNEAKCTKRELMESLEQANVKTEAGAYCENAFYLIEYDNLEQIPAFKNGWITVQDESSMMVGLAAGVTKDSVVMDLCAAPGGKTLHLADRMLKSAHLEEAETKDKKVTGFVEARDISEYKISLIRENLERCRYSNVSLKVFDAALYDESMQEKADIVIADLPCSGTGVIGKKPDIKYNISKDQQDELCQLQKTILRQAVRYIKPGGILIYSTCTLNKKENDKNRDFIINELQLIQESLLPYLPDKLLTHEDIKKTAKEGYIQLIPGIHKTDGFYVSRFRKKG